MGSVIREWVGFQQFPSATQAKLVELFAKLKEEVILPLCPFFCLFCFYFCCGVSVI